MMKTIYKHCLSLVRVIMVLFLMFLYAGCEEEDSSAVKENKNVIGMTFDVTNWSYSSPNYSVNLFVPELTNENINTAGVMVYFSTLSSPGNWVALPYTQYNEPYNYVMGFNTSVGNVQITWFYDYSLSSGKNTNDYYSSIIKYKVVIVSPEAMRLHPTLNYLNYNEVKKAFDLVD